MILAFANPDVMVFDHVLSNDDSQYLWTWFQTQKFTFINTGSFRKVFRILDGNPLVGDSFQFSRNDITTEGSSALHPSIYSVFRAVDERSSDLALLLGTEWRSAAATLYAYPLGTGLSWHTDGTSAGAFLFYLHPEWRADWGGELLIASGVSSRAKPPPRKISASEQVEVIPAFDQSFENECLLEEGLGTYIFPKPNRLILLRTGVRHMIKRVEAAAGSAMRCSVAGILTL